MGRPNSSQYYLYYIMKKYQARWHTGGKCCINTGLVQFGFSMSPKVRMLKAWSPACETNQEWMEPWEGGQWKEVRAWAWALEGDTGQAPSYLPGTQMPWSEQFPLPVLSTKIFCLTTGPRLHGEAPVDYGLWNHEPKSFLPFKTDVLMYFVTVLEIWQTQGPPKISLNQNPSLHSPLFQQADVLSFCNPSFMIRAGKREQVNVQPLVS